MRLIFIIRSVLATIVLILATIVFGILVIIGAGVFKSRKMADLAITSWARTILWAFNIKVEVRGLENVPAEGCLFLFNHSSHFDIPVIQAVLPKSARFGAKIELFKIPIFGLAMKAAGALPIVRADPSQVFKLYDESIARVHAGESFTLAAEGTRQPVPGVGPKFKAGPFVFALNGQFPLVPVVIRGAAECLPKGELLGCSRAWRHKVQVQVLPAVLTKGLNLEDRPQLQEKVRSSMVAAFDSRQT